MIHLVFDSHGRETSQLRSPAVAGEGAAQPRHMRDVLRDVHTTLVKQGIRDQVTLVASGGIALAEHVPKAIICGADLVAIDIPLVLAMECRMCGQCESGEPCSIALEEMSAEYGAHRIVNLIGAWHQQLIEVLGAMGIREVRRLRGETRPRDVLRGPGARDVRPLVRQTKELGNVTVSTIESTPPRGKTEGPEDFLARPEYAQVSREVRPRASPLPQRNRQVQRAPLEQLPGLRPVRRSLRLRRARPPQGIRAGGAAVRLSLHRALLRRVGTLLHRGLPPRCAVAGRQSGLRDDGRLPLVARPVGRQLGHGRVRQAAPPRTWNARQATPAVDSIGSGFAFRPLRRRACARKTFRRRWCSTAAMTRARR